MNKKKIIIIGAGISGLTAGVYLARDGHNVEIFEKTSEIGGLVNSFIKDNVLFDTGPRAIGNAGILKPMLEDLEIDLPLVNSSVSIGIKDQIVNLKNRYSYKEYTKILLTLFPEENKAITKIEKLIKRYSFISRVLNRVPNPFFKYNPIKLLLWSPLFLYSLFLTSMDSRSVKEVLESITDNKSLIDMVSQSFFKGTPVNFALGYFENFLDYLYPLGGTIKLPEALKSKFQSYGGKIIKETIITSVDSNKRVISDSSRMQYNYDKLIWAADIKTLYSIVSPSISTKNNIFKGIKDGESVFTIFITVETPSNWFSNISNGHFIYTPSNKGLGELHRMEQNRIIENFKILEKDEIYNWIKQLCFYTSYEISIPSLKDGNLTKDSKTGLIISFLSDGELFKLIEEAGWYNEVKDLIYTQVINILDRSIYSGIKDKIVYKDIATPLTLYKRFGNSSGAITGWSMEGKIPVPNSLFKIMKSYKTPFPNIYKSGQWSYSPSGVPTAILTGRIAAKAAGK